MSQSARLSFPPDTATRIFVLFPEHLLRLDRPRHLIVDEAVEATFAEGRIVPGEADDCLGLTFRAIHSWSSDELSAVSHQGQKSIPG